MKKNFLFILIISCAGVSILTGQKKNIDPRQFVKIYEENRQTNKSRCVFTLDSINRSILDKNSIITIEFNQETMSKTLDYYGNISIIAKINNEQIKVSPYSKVGEKQGQIGINSESPIEISSHLINLISEMEYLESEADSLLTHFSFENDDQSSNVLFADLNFSKSFFEKLKKTDTIQYDKLPSTIRKTLSKYMDYSPLLLILSSEKEIKFNSGEICSELKLIQDKLQDRNSKEFIESQISEMVEYKEINQNLDIVRRYLDYFMNRDMEIKGLYLRLTRQDDLGIDDFGQKLKECSKMFHMLDTLNPKYFTKEKQILTEKLYFLMSSIQLFNSDISRMLSNLTDTISAGVKASIEKIGDNPYDSIPKTEDRIEPQLTYAQIKPILAIAIGKMIYQKLLVGSIDLREARANDGDILKISLLWYQNNDTLSLPLELELTAFELKETGWRLKVADSFLLINRQSKPGDQTYYSPSVFKGAPGVSLLYSYGNDKSKRNIIRYIEPSLGINVSYLDFETNKDLEVGVGFVLGILHNQIFITYGYNLHAESKREYYGIGFSFANIANQVKKQ